MSKVLSAEQTNQYERDGILFPIPVLSTDEVLMFRSAFEETAAHFSGPPKPTRLPHLHFRWANDLATHPAILDVIEDVLGTDILVFSTMVFYKPPRDLSYISWHQDGLYSRMRTHQLTSAWIALNASTVENCHIQYPRRQIQMIDLCTRNSGLLKCFLVVTGMLLCLSVGHAHKEHDHSQTSPAKMSP